MNKNSIKKKIPFYTHCKMTNHFFFGKQQSLRQTISFSLLNSLKNRFQHYNYKHFKTKDIPFASIVECVSAKVPIKWNLNKQKLKYTQFEVYTRINYKKHTCSKIKYRKRIVIHTDWGLKQCPKTEISRVWICLEDSTIYSRLDLESDEFFYGPFIECSTDEFVV